MSVLCKNEQKLRCMQVLHAGIEQQLSSFICVASPLVCTSNPVGDDQQVHIKRIKTSQFAVRTIKNLQFTLLVCTSHTVGDEQVHIKRIKTSQFAQ
jgi:hypothetical protein